MHGRPAFSSYTRRSACIHIRLTTYFLLALGSTVANAQVASSSLHSETPVLELGRSIVRTLAGTEAHRYQVQLQAGQAAAIEVEQQGINVVVQVWGAADNLIMEVDDELGRQGTEKLELVAENDAAYTLAVRSRLKFAQGAYQIKLAEVGPASERDQSLYHILQLRTQVSALTAARKTQEALPLAQQALTLAQSGLEPADVHIAFVTRDLAEAYCGNGKTAECKAGFEEAVRMLTEGLGPDHPQTNNTKRQLASVCMDMDERPRADLLLSEVLESEEKTVGEDDPLVAKTLNTMGILHMGLGDDLKAEGEYERARVILEKAGLTDETQYGYLLNNLGIIHIKQREYDKALANFESYLTFQQTKFGTDSPSLWRTLANLGVVAKKKGDYPAAEGYYLRALALQGPDSASAVGVLSNLGSVYSFEGNFQKALETNQRALRIVENKSVSLYSRRTTLEAVAESYAALGDFANANLFQAQMESALEEEIASNLAIGSERQKLLYLDSIASELDDTVSLHLQFQARDTGPAALAALALLRRKGRVMDALADRVARSRRNLGPEGQALLDQLKQTTTQLAETALRGSQKQTLLEYRNLLKQLEEKKEQAENAISRQDREFRDSLRPVTLESVTSAIPENSALLEFISYRPSNPKAQSVTSAYGERHYAVYVLHRTGSPKGMDLGEAKDIDSLVEKLRSQLREPGRTDLREVARALGDKVFRPMEGLLVDDKHLLISPDGQLNLIPFEALSDAQGRYLIERFSITYVTTGRDLLRMEVPRPSRTAPVLVADPLFGEPSETAVPGGSAASGKTGPGRTTRRSITTGSDFSNLYFAPLAGTRAEAHSIHAFFPEARELTGAAASETALDQLAGPEILHIATHGFFLDDAGQEGAGNRNGTTPGPPESSSDPENPLLRSGLALAGANLVKDGKANGILTALAVSNLDLWGTKLVVLSACDTGVGEVKNGEGVYGLRRSFFLAGTESLVMSLWPVSDYVTRELMVSYYGGLSRGLGRGEALRQAQLAMMKRKGRQHPFYWATFIEAGEWANLEGRR